MLSLGTKEEVGQCLQLDLSFFFVIGETLTYLYAYEKDLVQRNKYEKE